MSTAALADPRDAGATVRQATGITVEVLARIEATAHQPRPRGRGKESPDIAKACGTLDIAIIRTMRDCLARVSEAAGFTWQQIERHPERIVAAAKTAGLVGVSNHGCRVGMAQSLPPAKAGVLARAKGIELPAIMQAGGWTTETTVARYTARESARRGAVARFYAQQDG